MTTLVCFHAHPDDESIATGGVMAMAAEAGHRVVLVVATDGGEGEVDDGFLDAGESLADRRHAETHESARILGVSRVVFLGYRDSGMMGEPTNDHPDCFWKADLGEAAERLADILRDEEADVLTVYDENGNYGHPDHIQVHRVGIRAAELAGTPRVYEATVNRTYLMGLMELAGDALSDLALDDEAEAEEGGPPDVSELGVTEDRITHDVDVSRYAATKRASMRAHASQIGEQSFFLAMPDDVFAMAFGREFFIDRSAASTGPPFATSIF